MLLQLTAVTMVPRAATLARNIAATLITASGITHIASLWFRDISSASVAAALFGAVYLFVGLGLYGQSRFALFMGAVAPAAGAWLALKNSQTVALTPLGLAHLSCGVAVIIISLIVLLVVRNNPSV